MYMRPAAPRTIGGVLDDAIRLYRASFSHAWPLSLVSSLLSAIVGSYATLSSGALQAQALILSRSSGVNATVLAGNLARIQRVERSPAVWGSYLLLLLIWLAFQAAIVRRQDAVAEGREDSFGEALGYGVRHLPELVIGAVVFLLAIIVGFMLLVIPGIWVWGGLELWLVALCAEDLGPFAALGRSWKLIERHWWHTSTTIFIAGVIIWVLSFVGGLLAAVLTVAFRGDATLVLAISQLLGAAINVFTAPMLIAVMLSLFYDLKLRREGGDLAARVNRLQTT